MSLSLPVLSNPIFQRYARSRLRPQGLTVAIIVTLLVSGFIFFGLRAVSLYRADMTPVDAERMPLMMLMGLQGLILFFLGTGQVAAGMTAEADEGTLDYQRLTPLSPMSKVTGYLFGLPVREYVMVLCTLPFTAWGIWKGQVPTIAWVSMYGVFFSSAILYHLTGLVAGTVVKNRRWAFLVSIGVIFLMYTAMPQVAKFGLTTFKYLTMWPVIYENAADFSPANARGLLRAFQNQAGGALFFKYEFSDTVFTLFVQGGVIATFLVMLRRRWRRSDSHLLGKPWALGVMVWTQVMLLGNALPLIFQGHIFPSRAFQNSFMQRLNWQPDLLEAGAMVGVYGVLALMMMYSLVFVITPNQDTQVRGLRRAKKLGRARPPWWTDAASSFWFALLMAGIGAAGWTIFTREILGSHWFSMSHVFPRLPGVFGLTLFTAALVFQPLLERWGGKAVFLAAAFVAVAPLMLAVVLAATGNRFSELAIWLGGISPLVSPVYAVQAVAPATEMPLGIRNAFREGFWIWQTVFAFTGLLLALGLWRSKRRRVKQHADQPEDIA